MPFLFEPERERHAVARRVGGGEQLLGIGARAVLESRAEVVLRRESRLSPEAPLSLETALPFRGRASRRHLVVPVLVNGRRPRGDGRLTPSRPRDLSPA